MTGSGVLRFSATLALLMLGACSHEMSVGGDDQDASCGLDGGGCVISTSTEIQMTPALADASLSATWSMQVVGTQATESADGGVWLGTIIDAGLLLQHVSASGDLDPENHVVPAPEAPSGLTTQGYLNGLTAHPDGPVATLRWDWMAPPGTGCHGQSDPSLGGAIQNCGGRLEFVLPLGTKSVPSPIRLNACDPMLLDGCSGPIGYRSLDGQTVLAVDGRQIWEYALSGQLLSQTRLPPQVNAFGANPTGPDRWVMMGWLFPYDHTPWIAGVVTYQRGSAPVWREFGDIPTPGVADGLAFAGPMSGQSISVITANNSFSGVQRSSDLLVLRLDHDTVTEQQLLTQQQFAGLPLFSASTTRDGHVYVMTATADRAAADQGVVSPLLCHFPPQGPGTCFSTPRSGALFALGDGVVLMFSAGASTSGAEEPVTTSTLARYDVP